MMISVRSLTKYYGSLRALHNVSFELNKGEIAGILGPNGSGKTTLLRILTTYLEPTSGDASVNGFDIFKDPLELRRTVGYLPENNILYMNMTVRNFLVFSGKARGLRGNSLKDRLNWCVDALTLKEVLDKRNYECSKGFRQRIALAAALIHDPKVIILDEPTSGLDPIQIIAFRDFLQSLSENRVIIISSHVIQEIAALATRIIILHKGEVKADLLKGGILEGAYEKSTEKLESFFVNSIQDSDESEKNDPEEAKDKSENPETKS